MRSRFTVNLAFITLTGFASSSAMAAGCELTAEQAGFLAENNIVLEVPAGDVPVIRRCDTNGDSMVDIVDIRAISMKRNQPAAHPDDPMDWDRDSVITLVDARNCQQLCGRPRCAVGSVPPPEPEGTSEAAECIQAEDTDNDGEVDELLAVTENEAGGGERSLGVVFIKKVEGEVKTVKDSYAGKTKTGTVDLHLSKQPAGTVNLAPGTVELTQPGTVAYQDGQPKTLYYVEEGKLKRAAFGVDD